MARDAIELLTSDHRAVEALFEQVRPGSVGKNDVVERIVRELSIHDAIERELLYPTVKERLSSQGESLPSTRSTSTRKLLRCFRKSSRRTTPCSATTSCGNSSRTLRSTCRRRRARSSRSSARR